MRSRCARPGAVPDLALPRLEGWETEDWPGQLRINPNTHQIVRDYFFLRCKKADQMKSPFDYADIVAASAAPGMPDDLNECKDIGAL